MLFTSNANKGKEIKKAPNAALPSGLETSAKAGPGGGRGGPYQSRQNMQKQRNGFGAFVQKFQTVSGKSKYGVPIFLPNGNVNPAYLAAERAEIQSQSKFNTVKAEKKRKDLIKQGKFQLADYIKKAIGDVGSGKEYYQSGR